MHYRWPIVLQPQTHSCLPPPSSSSQLDRISPSTDVHLCPNLRRWANSPDLLAPKTVTDNDQQLQTSPILSCPVLSCPVLSLLSYLFLQNITNASTKETSVEDNNSPILSKRVRKDHSYPLLNLERKHPVTTARKSLPNPPLRSSASRTPPPPRALGPASASGCQVSRREDERGQRKSVEDLRLDGSLAQVSPSPLPPCHLGKSGSHGRAGQGVDLAARACSGSGASSDPRKLFPRICTSSIHQRRR